MQEKNRLLGQTLTLAPIIPVLTIQKEEDAVPLARALCAGGLPVLEITLRSACAVAAMKQIADEVPEAVVGAGTVTTPEDLELVAEAGATFAVSPGLTPRLLAAAVEGPLPLLPGVATPSEVMMACDHGLEYLKLFPAEVLGGVARLKAFAGPFADLKFCPTGGVKLSNLADYLCQPNVICVGGTWLTPESLVAAGDWAGITALAQEAVAKAALVE